MDTNILRYHSADWYMDYEEGESYESEDESDKQAEGDIEEEEANIDPGDLSGNVNELFRHIYNE